MLRMRTCVLGLIALIVVVPGCASVLGLDDYEEANGGAAASTTGASPNGPSSGTVSPTGSGMPTGSNASTVTSSGDAASSSTGVPPVSGELLSLESWGEAGDQEAWSVAVAPDGSVYIAGLTSGTLIAGNVTLTVADVSLFLIKLDPTGVPEWGKTYPFIGDPGSRYNMVYGVEADADGAYIAGMAEGQLDFGTSLVAGFFAGHIGVDGTVGWTKGCGGTAAYGAVDNGGSTALGVLGGKKKLYVAVLSSGAVNCGGLDSTGNFFVRLDAGTGAHEVSTNIDADTYDFRSAVAPDANGGAYYGDRTALASISQQGVVGVQNPCLSAIALAVDALSGDLLGVHSPRANLSCGGPEIEVASGYTAFAFLRFDAALGYKSQLVLSEGGRGKSIALAPAGDIALAGDHELALDFGSGPLSSAGLRDAAFALYDPAMNLKWAKQLRGLDEELVNDVAANDQMIVAVGSFASASAQLGATPLTGKGGKDVWIARVAR